MKYFAPSYLITTSLALLSSRLASTFPTGENTTIAKASNNSSGLAITPNQHTDFTNQYFDEASIKIIKEAASPAHSNNTAEQLMLVAGYSSYARDNETPVNEDDLVSLFEKPTDNSYAVHHRGKRGVGDISEVQSITLSNQNCFAVGVKRHPANGHIEWGELYKECYDEPCKDPSFVSSNKGTSFSWGYVLKDLVVRSVNNGQMAEIEFSHLTSSWTHKQSYPVYHTCNLPLSPRYQHLNECNKLSSAGKYQEALTECNKALEVDPNFTQALEQKAALEELLAALTTIEPSPSSAENSTPTANSTTITEENTPNLEPHNAPFNRGSVPTAAPHEQTTKGQGWSLKDILTAAGSATIAVITVGGIATYIYNKGTAIYQICQEYCSKTEAPSLSKEPYSTFVFLVPNVEDINLMGNGPGDADSSKATL
ncbi:MAG: tetratricopeptide repeat protein [Rickettsiaceae bacterium]|nr:tetratricopeptide repeat protein [Rickettsiaceae bacterium]MDD9336915.1 tetratricopeptide repeat protein [Rickettsiaceae bacterium]